MPKNPGRCRPRFMPRIPLEPEVECQFREELLYCSPSCPYRPTRWRFRRAELLFVLNFPARARRDDVWLQRAYDYHRDVWRLRARPPGGRARRAVPDPVIEGALDLWATTDLLCRWEVEARILADQPYSEVAARTGISEPVIDAYEALFFNVAASRHATKYLEHAAIGVRESDGFGVAELHQVWKLFGLLGGPRVLDVVMDVFPGPDLVPRTDGFVLATKEEADGLRLMVKLLTTPRDQMSVEQMTRMWPQLLRRQRRKAEANALGAVTVPWEKPVAPAGSPDNPKKLAVNRQPTLNPDQEARQAT